MGVSTLDYVTTMDGHVTAATTIFSHLGTCSSSLLTLDATLSPSVLSPSFAGYHPGKILELKMLAGDF